LSGCLLVHRDLFERAGGFDERFRPNYGEDDAFGFDLARAGGTVRMVGEASVLHNDHGGDTSDEQLLNIAKRQAHHRWVLYLVAVRGWRRVLAVAVGLPRSIQDSIRVRAMYPLWGYLRALLRAPELLRPKPRPGPLAERGEVIGVTQSTR
jgi:GT2 family glycosyltransferase